ncbi:MAG: FliG C-terminal domain-containing protein [Spirochaetales bacterium]
MKLSEFAEQTERHDRAIQMALRETDMSVMAEFLAGVPVADRAIIYRNMSDRACEMLMNTIAEIEDDVSAVQQRRAEQFFMQRLSRFLNYTSREQQPIPEHPPALDFSSDDALVASLVMVSRYERAHGTLSLDEIVDTVEHPIAKKGLQMTIDGWDPVEERAILERLKQTYLAAAARTIDIVIAGIECLGTDEHPLVIEERLNAFLPSTLRPRESDTGGKSPAPTDV